MTPSISCPECGHDEPRVRLEWSHKIVKVEEPSGVPPPTKVVTLSAMQLHQGTEFVRCTFVCQKCAHVYERPRGVSMEYEMPEAKAWLGLGAHKKTKKHSRPSLHIIPGGRE